MPSPSRSTDEKKLPRLETRQLLFSGFVAVASWPSGWLAVSLRPLSLGLRVPRNPRIVCEVVGGRARLAPGLRRGVPPPRAGRDRAGEYRRPRQATASPVGHF